ncbi:T9SS type A sorting domain-containing protein [Aureispira]|nr:T9SS type A sorting domain-containing protein [Aureispira sp.]
MNKIKIYTILFLLLIVNIIVAQTISINPSMVSNEIDNNDNLTLEITGTNINFQSGTGTTSCTLNGTIWCPGNNNEDIVFVDSTSSLYPLGGCTWNNWGINMNIVQLNYSTLFANGITDGIFDVKVGSDNSCYVTCNACFEFIDFSIENIYGNFCEGGSITIDYENNASSKFSNGNTFSAYLVRTYENQTTLPYYILDTTIIGSISTTLTGSITGTLPQINSIVYDGRTYDFTSSFSNVPYIYIAGNQPTFRSESYALPFYDTLNNSSPELCMVTVDSTGYNKVIWNRNENILNTSDVTIYKETSFTGIYDDLGTYPVNDAYYIDSNSNPAMTPSTYAFKTIDSCARPSQLSTPHKTMHLTVNSGQNGAWNLIWSQYLGTNIPSYRIWRGNSMSNLSVIDSVSGSTYTYSDLTPPTGILFYQIEVLLAECGTMIMKTGTNYNSTRSNIVNNGLTSTMQNELFAKKIVFPNPTKGILIIEGIQGNTELYSIHGKLITSTATQTLDISHVPPGIYFVKTTDSQGRVYAQKVLKE